MKAKLEIASNSNGDIFVFVEIHRAVKKLRYGLNYYSPSILRNDEPPSFFALEFTYYKTDSDGIAIFKLTGVPDEMARGTRIEVIE